MQYNAEFYNKDQQPPQPEAMKIIQTSFTGTYQSTGSNNKNQRSRSNSQNKRLGKHKFSTSNQEDPTKPNKTIYNKNPEYAHVQSKVYTSTISHDLKRGKPPTHQKTMEIKQQAENQFRQEYKFQPQINKNYRMKKDEPAS